MNDDKELEILKQKKIKELMKRIENQNKQDDPKEILSLLILLQKESVLHTFFLIISLYCF